MIDFVKYIFLGGLMDKNKVIKKSVPDQLFKIFKDNILNNHWKTGERIPSELELMKDFNVSRSSVRTAISQLITLGLIEVKRGDGTFVKEISPSNYIKEVFPFLIKNKNNAHLLEVRNMIEKECVEILIKNYDLEKIKKLEEFCNLSESFYLNKDYENYIKIDSEFHRLICKFTENDLLLSIYEIISESFFKSSAENLSKVIDSDMKRESKLHKNLVKSIKNKDLEEAQILVHRIVYNEI